MIEKRDY